MYTREQLLSLRLTAPTLRVPDRRTIRERTSYRPRGCRAGRHIHRYTLRSSGVQNTIPVITGSTINRASRNTTCTPPRRSFVQVPLVNNNYNGLRLGLLNVRSINNKSASVHDVISSGHYGAFVAVESWHDDVMSPSLALACPQGYCYTERARPRSTQSMNSLGTNHGGIVVFHQTSYRVGIDLPNLVTMEALGLRITSGSSTIVLIAIYRTGTINDLFFEEFERVIEAAAATNCRVIVVGDFNIHMDVIDDTSAVRFRRVLVSCGLQQHVTVATHNAGHTLDLVISDDLCDELDSLELHDLGLSDQARIKREGHRGHLPRAPFLQGAPATEKKTIITIFNNANVIKVRQI